MVGAGFQCAAKQPGMVVMCIAVGVLNLAVAAMKFTGA